MSTRNRLLVFGAASLLLAAWPALAQRPHKAQPKTPPAESAIIENTGSTNTTGYRITVSSTGTATVDGKAVSLPAGMSTQFFRDLAAALPLPDLPARHGIRSASFGTRTSITYRGQRTPDLTFGGDARATALKADVDAIAGALHVSNMPRRPILMRPIAPEPPPARN